MAGGLLASLALARCGGRFEVELDDATAPAPLPSAPDVASPGLGDALADAPPSPRDAADGPDGGLDAGLDGSLDARVDAADAAPLRRVFRTSRTYGGAQISGQGGGVGARGGDFICAQVAADAGLSGTFRAWLSDSTQSAAQRITAPGPYYDVTRTKLLFTGNPTAGAPLASIPDQTGALGTPTTVWTGTGPTGNALAHCGGWDLAGRVAGTVGRADLPAFWTNSGTSLCANARHIYCFEQ